MPRKVGREGEWQLRYVRKAVEVVLRDPRLLKEAAVERALGPHAADGLFQLPELVFVKERVVHGVEVPARGLRLEFLVFFYPQPQRS